MAVETDDRHRGIPGYIRAALVGRHDPRLRASWRLLLAFPLLLLPGRVAQAVMSSLPVSGRGAMLAAGLLQAGAFGLFLVGWARYVDRRPLADYGVSASRSWLAALAAGFGAVVAGHLGWYAIGSGLGWTDASPALSAPAGSLAVGLLVVLVGVGVNVWVQETAYFAVVLRSAAEGLDRRGLAARRAVLGGWLAAVVFFASVHAGTLGRPELFVAGGVFGLLYAHTGELALPIGVHLGVNYAGHALFVSASSAGTRPTVVVVTEAVPGLLATASAARLPQLLIAYLLVLAWLRWRRGAVGLESSIVAWTPR